MVLCEVYGGEAVTVGKGCMELEVSVGERGWKKTITTIKYVYSLTDQHDRQIHWEFANLSQQGKNSF